MLQTPLGDVKIFLDGKEVVVTVQQVFNDLFRDVTAYHLKYHHSLDGKKHVLRCILCDTDLKGDNEGGGDIETIAFESIDPFARLSIGIDGEFIGYYCNQRGEHIQDGKYEGCHLEDGLEVEINDDISEFVFAVAWMFDYTDETSHHTWYMADPVYGNEA